jgi:hypothetical protein
MYKREISIRSYILAGMMQQTLETNGKEQKRQIINNGVPSFPSNEDLFESSAIFMVKNPGTYYKCC